MSISKWFKWNIQEIIMMLWSQKISFDHIVFSRYLHSGVKVKTTLQDANNGSQKNESYTDTFTNHSSTCLPVTPVLERETQSNANVPSESLHSVVDGSSLECTWSVSSAECSRALLPGWVLLVGCIQECVYVTVGWSWHCLTTVQVNEWDSTVALIKQVSDH